MRVTHVSLYSNEEEALTFSLRNVGEITPYLIRAMIGLDADTIISKFYAFGGSGSKFYEMSLPPREIVLRVDLNPRYNLGETVSDIRDDLYGAISSTRNGEVTLHFKADGVTLAGISGFITKFEVPHFSKTSEVQITIRCDDPIFRGINPVHLDSDDLGSTSPISVFDNISTSPHGFDLKVTFNDDVDSFNILESTPTPDWSFIVTPDDGFEDGDILYFSNQYGVKSLYMDRSASITHLADKVDNESVWPLLFRGSNQFYIPNIADMTINYVEYNTSFWGI